MRNLEATRNEIDQVDDALVKLLKRRLELSLEVKEIKKTDSTGIFDPQREEKIIQRLQEALPEEHHGYLSALYTLIFKYSRSLQSK